MNHPKSSVDKLRLLLDEIEESILRLPDDEIAEESGSYGMNLDAVADQVGNLIGSGVKGHRQKKLRAAQEGYRESVNRQERCTYTIPRTPAELRALLDSILSSRGDVPTEITMAFREGRQMSDDDVASILEDLAELGFLREEDEGGA